MERSSAVLWTYILGAGLTLVIPRAFFVTTSEASPPRPPRLIGCVFMIYSNVTCRWEPGDTAATTYTLQVQSKPGGIESLSSPKMFTCSTSGTSCTARIGRFPVRMDFCISIIAHSGSSTVSSQPRCQPGRKEAIFWPPILNSAQPVRGSPECLNVSWSRTVPYCPVSDSEIEAGHLKSQIQFASQEESTQVDVQVRSVTVTRYSILVCLFRPDTSYIIRLRHRYQGPASPWSQWSNDVQGRTAEAAPSAAPVLWREVKHTDLNGCRVVSLLWKPLPHSLANGRVVLYSVSCRTENAEVLSDHGSCKDLQHATTRCDLTLPAGRWSCALTASTSAGTSPEARIWIGDSSKTELPPPSQIAAAPLDDQTLEVKWTSPPSRQASGFVVEWFAVREQSGSDLHWEKLNSSCTKLLVTEGVKPMERYAVSVRALFGDRGAGRSRTLYTYTREGTPSAGPDVNVQHLSGSSVELSWSPPPVELLHGFICNYTLFYSARNQPAKSVFVPGDVHRYTLENMSPGIHDVFMRVNTAYGAGPAGKPANVHVGFEEVSVSLYVIIPIILTSLMLILMAGLAQMKTVKQKLCGSIPDPSNSTLSYWIPETSFETKKLVLVQEKPEVSYSEVVLLEKMKDLKNSSLPPLLWVDFSYAPVKCEPNIPSKV